MEENIIDAVLLVGEANFSFTLSLVKYCEAKHITTSCYENEEQVKKRYGAECVLDNVRQLSECRQVLFAIDACRLREYFEANTFQRVIFMFPHVGGKSNIKKNRELIENFLLSTRDVLKASQFDLLVDSQPISTYPSKVFIVLAKGQGGTRFEQDEDKRNAKDSWTVNELANRAGFILTSCQDFNENKFDYYKSTGYRSGARSFHTKAGLVHEFQLSLPISSSSFRINTDLSNLMQSFIEKSLFLTQVEFQKTFQNPLNQFKHVFIAHLRKTQPEIHINFIEDELNLIALNDLNNSYKMTNELLEKYFKPINEANSKRKNLCLRQNLDKDVLEHLLNRTELIEVNKLNVLSGLVLSNRTSHDFRILLEKEGSDEKPIIEVNNLKHETLFYFVGSHAAKSQLKTGLLKVLNEQFFANKLSFNEEPSGSTLIVEQNDGRLQFVGKIEENENELICCLDSGFILCHVVELSDERLLYSNDKRALVKCEAGEFDFKVRPFIAEPTRCRHDVSFWCELDSFDLNAFLDTIRDTSPECRTVQLLNTFYSEERSECKQALCFRLIYEPCDRALCWKMSTQIQDVLREKLSLRNKFILS